ncbi:hypothetical protein NY607_07080 [Lysinibacillus sp. A4]|uniref:hypothetical protein n=1 Tax=Lysinibacillus sp. A4 TaxID=2976269 RepID=UPI002175869B|nr:hypothetical protein [Lysinibacillus sp. A4]MCS5500887.1 hypothetical protein [Lysinibacillus sp. A4]
MKKYIIEFYSNNGYKLGECVKEYKDFSEVEDYIGKLMKEGSSVKITFENSAEFIRVTEIAKVVITEQK